MFTNYRGRKCAWLPPACIVEVSFGDDQKEPPFVVVSWCLRDFHGQRYLELRGLCLDEFGILAEFVRLFHFRGSEIVFYRCLNPETKEAYFKSIQNEFSRQKITVKGWPLCGSPLFFGCSACGSSTSLYPVSRGYIQDLDKIPGVFEEGADQPEEEAVDHPEETEVLTEEEAVDQPEETEVLTEEEAVDQPEETEDRKVKRVRFSKRVKEIVFFKKVFSFFGFCRTVHECCKEIYGEIEPLWLQEDGNFLVKDVARCYENPIMKNSFCCMDTSSQADEGYLDFLACSLQGQRPTGKYLRAFCTFLVPLVTGDVWTMLPQKILDSMQLAEIPNPVRIFFEMMREKKGVVFYFEDVLCFYDLVLNRILCFYVDAVILRTLKAFLKQSVKRIRELMGKEAVATNLVFINVNPRDLYDEILHLMCLGVAGIVTVNDEDLFAGKKIVRPSEWRPFLVYDIGSETIKGFQRANEQLQRIGVCLRDCGSFVTQGPYHDIFLELKPSETNSFAKFQSLSQEDFIKTMAECLKIPQECLIFLNEENEAFLELAKDASRSGLLDTLAYKLLVRNVQSLKICDILEARREKRVVATWQYSTGGL